MSVVHRAALRRRRSPGAAIAVALLAAALLTGCDTGQGAPDSDEQSGTRGSSTAADPDGPADSDDDATPVAEVELDSSIAKGATDVSVETPLTLNATAGTLESVRVKGSDPVGELAGAVASDGASWASTGRLEPNTTYVVTAKMVDSDGETAVRRTGFSTQTLSLDEQTYPSVAPLQGETVGVGMPVIVTFDVPVSDKASFEKHLSVETTPAQVGTWRWFSDTEVHYRPKKYWQAGTQVKVDVDVNSVPAGDGVYGQESRTVDFTVGDAHVYKVNARTHQMQVFANGQKLRSIPITTGKAGFTTRSGTKVIVEKFDSKRMNSETVGIPSSSADAYDIDNVQWAMRVTFSGEFIHAAPWSVGSQGVANVSHGCTGMSTANADWLYRMSRRGDVVEYTGTDKPMTLDNGYGDWNEDFATYKQGSAV